MNINIVKRNGKTEPLKLDKISVRIKKQIYDLDLNFINPDRVAIDVVSGLFEGATTRQIDELIAEQSASKATTHPDYSKLAARILVSSLHKDTPKTFSNAMEELYKDNCISEHFMNLTNKYKNVIDDYIKHERDFNFDYFGFKTLQKAYLLKNEKKKIIERPQYMYMRVALTICQDDIEDVLKTYDLLSEGYYTHATPTLFNSGTNLQQLSSCFLLKIDEDSLDEIYKILTDTAKISRLAGGIGISISKIRAKNSLIKGTNGLSDGIIPMLKVYNETARYVNQSGKRKGSFAIYLEPWHDDIFDFIDLKKNHGKEEMRARDLFLAIWSNDLFMEAVNNDGDWYLMCPNESPGLHDCYGQEFKELYVKYVSEGNYRRKIKARDLWMKILENQIETGLPYILHKDTINEKSNQKNIGIISSSNLCVAPETQILTDNGYISIGENEGKVVNVWNGKQWSETQIIKTGENKELLKITFSNGSIIECTPYHKFYLRNGMSFLQEHLDKEHNILNDINKETVASQLKINDKIQRFFIEDKLFDDITVTNIDNTGRISDTYCVNEPLEHKVIFNGILTGNCAEIVEFTSKGEEAVCNLASIGLPMFVKGNEFNYQELYEVSYMATKNLDRVIDINFYPTNETNKSNNLHRPIGLGVNGLADVFAMLKIPFDSIEAKEVNKKIFETMYFASLDASSDLALEKGKYSTFDGSPLSKGIFQFDMWENRNVGNNQILNKEPIQLSGLWDFEKLKDKISKNGTRNSLNIAIMPTASTSQILGNNECIEPFTSNIYSRNTGSGSFVMTNKYLIKELIELGLWNDNVRKKIISNGGSVQMIDELPEELRYRYRTVYEMKMKDIIDMSADRGPFICQTQSLNLFFSKVNYAKLSTALTYGWLKGLKTGSYYIRTETSTKANALLGMDMTETKIPKTEMEEIACSLDDPEGCLACSA